MLPISGARFGCLIALTLAAICMAMPGQRKFAKKVVQTFHCNESLIPEQFRGYPDVVLVDPCDNPKLCTIRKGEPTTVTVVFTAKNTTINSTDTGAMALFQTKSANQSIPSSWQTLWDVPMDACHNSGLDCPLQAGSMYAYNTTFRYPSNYTSGEGWIRAYLLELLPHPGHIGNYNEICFRMKANFV